jgi:hypothetical protein
MTVTDTQPPDRNQAMNAVSRGEISAPDYDELRNEMRRAMEAREKSEIARVFIRATDISAKATGSEARYKKGKDIKRHVAFREIGLRVDLLRAQWLVETEKAKLRFMGRPAKGQKAGTPAPPHLLTLSDFFPRHLQDQARKLSQDLQLLSKLSPEEFEALVADPDAPRPRWGREIRVLPLSAIRFDERAQPRAALLTERVVDEYTEAMQRGAKFPAPIVFEDAAGVFWPGDGHHRIAAATKLKLKTIECEVRSGGLREAILYSCGANATHGLPRTRDDKHRAVTKLLDDEEWKGWSDNKIAKQCKVSNHLVAQLRKELEPVTLNSLSEPRTYTNKHGTTSTMNTANIGRKAKPAASGAGRPPPAPNDALDDVAQHDKPAPESTEFAAEPVVEHPAPSKDDARSAPDLAPAKTDAAPLVASTDPAPPPDLHGLHCAAVLDTIRGTIRGLTDQVAAIPANQLLEVRSELDEVVKTAVELRAVITQAIESATVREKEPPLPAAA